MESNEGTPTELRIKLSKRLAKLFLEVKKYYLLENNSEVIRTLIRELIDKYREELKSAAKWWAEKQTRLEKMQMKGARMQVIISFIAIGVIIGGTIALAFIGKIQGETFVAIISMVIGYLLTLIDFSAIAPPKRNKMMDDQP